MSYPQYLTAEEKLEEGKQALSIPRIVVICGSTRAEIRYAASLGKPIRYTHPEVNPLLDGAA